MASAEAFKRLKPPVEARPERGRGPATKADRRHDGQQRRSRNDGQQRHPHRGEGHSAHRSGAQDHNGQRRDEQRSGVRSSYRPEAYREAGESARPARPTEGRNDFRPSGGQPKRKFHGRPRRPGGGPRRAHG